MRTITKICALLFVFSLVACGGGEKKEKESFAIKKAKTETTKVEKKENSSVPASKKVDLESKGVGPITSITLNAKIDKAMAAKGEETFKKMCTACHRIGKKFIGPAPDGIMERRTPEWVMNMILNPTEMVQKDALAKELLMEFNGSPMSNQNLSEEEARAVVEYFRTL
ncbi:c-type cytochrome [Sediminicola luteus]|uniref:Cytochrome C n=1 Tax=Sediminicola luteus TaxID=319238 RepID=A0A2A4G8L3_9FLAO|nr:cytochrome c [Sediminicola luteus]PCE64095.1 cytochrome C [Sediminicola luteus]